MNALRDKSAICRPTSVISITVLHAEKTRILADHLGTFGAVFCLESVSTRADEIHPEKQRSRCEERLDACFISESLLRSRQE